MNRYTLLLCLLLVLPLIGAACAQQVMNPGHNSPNPSPRRATTDPARAVVVWISVDGVRPDYLDRAPTPFLDRLMREGAYTRQLVPVFPSLTFPSHVSQATGVPVSEHGVPGNSFYDQRTGQTYNFPGDAALLEAEPIWLTAARQGIRVASLDWPLSHAQAGPVRADYFGERFERDLTDEQRIGRLVEIWQQDDQDQPLQLLMSYMSQPDSVGHARGPDSPEVETAMAEADATLHAFFQQIKELFEQRMSPQDELWLIVTTDHGMAPVETLVNFSRLLEVDLPRHVQLVTSGNVGNIHLDGYEPQEREQMTQQLLRILRQHEFLRAFQQQDLPADYGYVHSSRVGDIIVVLDVGHTFSSRLPLPVYPVERVGSPLGMHGYGVDQTEKMLGIGVFWRYRQPLGGVDLGRVGSLQLHPTVAQILGITPAEGADAPPLELPPQQD